MKLASTLEINTPRFDEDLDMSHDAHAQSSPASQAAGKNEDILTSQEQVQQFLRLRLLLLVLLLLLP